MDCPREAAMFEPRITKSIQATTSKLFRVTVINTLVFRICHNFVYVDTYFDCVWYY